MEKHYEEKLIELTSSSKKKSKTSQKECGIILSKVYRETKNHDEIIDWCMKAHYAVTELFFMGQDFTKEDANNFADAIVKNKALDKKINIHVFPRMMIICSVFLKKNADPAAIEKILTKAINYGTKNNVYNAELIKSFEEYIIKGKLIGKLLDVKENMQDNNNKNTIMKFIAHIENGGKMVEKTADKKPSEATKISTPEKETKAKESGYDDSAKELKRNTDLLVEQVKKLTEVNDIVELLKASVENNKSSLTAKEDEIKNLKNSLNKANSENAILSSEILKLKNEIESNQAEIEDLRTRLKKSFDMDSSISRREVETLKDNIANALKIEYSDFRSIEMICNEDNFMAAYVSLEHIFKVLKRFGIKFE